MPESTRNSPSMPSIDIPSTVNTLIFMIDAHIAAQLADSTPLDSTSSLSRCSSLGTMFVDFDEHTASPIISYREKYSATNKWAERFNPVQSSNHSMTNTAFRTPSPPLLIADETLHVRRHHGRQNGIYIEGHDPETRFEYDYDGRIVHVHKESPRPESEYSDYYVVDANEYASQYSTGAKYRPMLTLVDEQVPHSPRESRKRDKVVTFIQELLGKLNTLGLLDRLKENKCESGRRRRTRKYQWQRVDSVVERVARIPEPWVWDAYVS